MRRFGALLAALISALIAVAPAGAMSPGTKAIVLLSGVNGQTFPGSTVDDLFTKGLCTNVRIALPCAQQLSTSRASTGLAQWADGHWSSFATNALRMTDQGLLIEEARTNSLRNSSMVGATVGTIGSGGAAPTNWVLSANGSLALQVVATGVLNGINYVDIRFFGTSNNTALTVYYDVQTAVAAAQNQTWTHSAFLALVGGSTTNITNFRPRIRENDSGGAAVVTNSGSNLIPSLTGSMTRQSYTATLSGATTAFAMAGFDLDYNNASAVDITIRFGWPQFEQGSFATSPIPTTNAATARAADIITLQGNAMTAALAGKAARTETNLGEGIVTSARLVDFSGSQRIAFNTTTVMVINNGTNNGTATIGGAGTYSGLVKTAFGFDAASMTVVANGGTPGTSANAWGAPAAPVYVGGLAAGNRELNGYFRRLTFGPAKGMFDGLTQ